MTLQLYWSFHCISNNSFYEGNHTNKSFCQILFKWMHAFLTNIWSLDRIRCPWVLLYNIVNKMSHKKVKSYQILFKFKMFFCALILKKIHVPPWYFILKILFSISKTINSSWLLLFVNMNFWRFANTLKFQNACLTKNKSKTKVHQLTF